MIASLGLECEYQPGHRKVGEYLGVKTGCYRYDELTIEPEGDAGLAGLTFSWDTQPTPPTVFMAQRIVIGSKGVIETGTFDPRNRPSEAPHFEVIADRLRAVQPCTPMLRSWYLAALGVLACSSSSLNQSPGGDGGGTGGAAGAGGATGGNAGTAGAGTGGQPQDAGVEAGAACPAKFCADFDDVTLPQEGWTIAEVTGGGMVSLTAIPDAPSAPNVFESTLQAGADNKEASIARISHQITMAGYAEKTPAVAMAFRAAVRSVDGAFSTMLANFRVGTMERYVGLAARAIGGAEYELNYIDTADPGNPHLVKVLTIGTWYDLRLTVAPRQAPNGGTTGGGVTVEVNGMPKSFTVSEGNLTEDLRFDLGLAVPIVGTVSAVVHYDAVRIDY